PFYGANKYYLFVKTVYNDVRMVAAPPSSIGKFGADTDNWMWPRHTGDVSLFRVYADKDGKPADYSASNVPLKVKKHIKINIGGIEKGDFAFVMGFPGRNWRYMISDEVEERMQTTNFMRHHVRDARQKVLMEQMLKDDALRIHYASKYASSANYWKNAIGMNEGLVKLKVLDTKKQQQEELLSYGKKMGTDEYQKAFDMIRSIVSKRRQPMYHQQALSESFVRGLDFMAIPYTDKLEKALKSKDKKEILAQVDSLSKRANNYFKRTPFVEVERLVAKEMFRVYSEYIEPSQRISIFSFIDKKFKGNTDAFVDYCFAKSIFGSKENFAKFAAKPSLKVLENDPMVMFANSIEQGMKNTSEAMREANTNYNIAHKSWVKGMMELRKSKGMAIYPDANSTLRLTYGQVMPYSPADGVEYMHYTT
ncbi:MAG: S46 family peptidase, partial [Bacteroides sp.]|nr:S46 family peptidase [Bacteroides sp.]